MNRGIFDIHFNSQKELIVAFEGLKEFMDSFDSICELEIKAHWSLPTLTIGYQSLFLSEIQILAKQYKDLKLTYSWPQCFQDEEKKRNFGSCSNCLDYKNRQCLWPYKMQTGYFTAPQRNFSEKEFPKISLDDFKGQNPITWFTPEKSKMNQLAQALSKSPEVLDFGCGNGFVSFLVEKENPQINMTCFDPLFKGFSLKNNFISDFKSFLPKSNYSVLCSMADYHVSLSDIFRLSSLPDVIALIINPDIFFSKGKLYWLKFKDMNFQKVKEQSNFSEKNLLEKGYSCILKKGVESSYSKDSFLSIYKGKDVDLDFLPIKEGEKYSWEMS